MTAEGLPVVDIERKQAKPPSVPVTFAPYAFVGELSFVRYNTVYVVAGAISLNGVYEKQVLRA